MKDVSFFVKKTAYLIFAVLVCVVLFGACSDDDDPTPPPAPEVQYPPSAKGITDLVLIYCVSQSRPAWTAENMTPYIYRMNGDKVEWLFDGFLFFDIYASVDGLNYDYGIPSIDDAYSYIPGKFMWSYLAYKIFETGKGPDALEEVLDDMLEEGHMPPSKRQVVIGIPNPTWGAGNWGALDGENLSFWDNNHRFAAVKWYMDQVEQLWEDKNYKHIELAGFYWINESLIVGYADDVIVKKVQAEVIVRGYEFSWIPYNGAGGVSEWKNYGFTTAYQQPNYFFDDVPNPDKMSRAIATAKQYDMAMEMEFDDRVITSQDFRDRFYTYMDEFEKAGVFDERRVAYYQGTQAILSAAKSTDAEVQKIYKTLCDMIVKRSGKFTEVKE